MQETVQFVQFDIIKEISHVHDPIDKERHQQFCGALRKAFDVNRIVPSVVHNFKVILSPDGTHLVGAKTLWNELPKILFIICLVKILAIACILSAEEIPQE